MAALSLALLGSLHVTIGGRAARFESDKARALLAYLCVEAGRPHRRETLMGLLWPESPEDTARRNLRQALYTLRQAIGDHSAATPYLLISRDEIQFNTASDYSLDIATFDALLLTCNGHAHQRLDTCAACAERLRQVVKLYRGEFLAQFFADDSAAFEEWALVQRESFHRRALDALTHLADYHEQRGEHDEARRYALRQLDLDPWREEAHRQVMRALAASGERSAALVQYDKCRQVLSTQLGVEPSAETRALYERISHGEFDSSRAETEATTSWPRPHLPAQMTPFVGREREIAELAQLLHDPQCRLLTLIGPGGIGKTRLALQLAIEHSDSFAHRAVFVPLVSLESPSLIVSAIADASGLAFAEPMDPKLQLLNYLRCRQVLLLLDNMEHLLQGVGLFTEILEQAPNVKLLVTSREPLNLRGEWVFDVGGLELPADDGTASLAQSSAVTLFLQRARRAQVGFALEGEDEAAVARICRLVGGMPLAIELAAAWVRTLSLREIQGEIEQNLDFLATSMRDVPERHRSMRAVFDHSWGLMSDQERQALAALSVFRGGFQREAAEFVARAPLSVLASLLAKSLLQRTPTGHYSMHELLRHYAASRLDGDSVEQLRAQEQHSLYYFNLLGRRDGMLRSNRQKQVLVELTAEMDNVRTAWELSISRQDISRITRVSATLWYLFELRNRFVEGENAFRRTVELLRMRAHASELDDTDVMLAVNAMQAHYAYFCMRQGKTREAYALLAPATVRLRASPNTFATIYAHWYLGILCWALGRYEEANESLRIGLTLAEASGERWYEAAILEFLGNIAHEQGAYNEACLYLSDALSLASQLGDTMVRAHALSYLCRTTLAQGAYADAETLLAESLALAQAIDYRHGIGLALDGLGQVAHAKGHLDQAASLFVDSCRVYKEIGDARTLSRVLNHKGLNALALGDIADAQASLDEALRLADEGGSVPAMLDALASLALVYANHEASEATLQLVIHVLEHPASRHDARKRAESLRMKLEAQLSPAQIEAAQAHARATTLEAMARHVLKP